MTACLKCTFFIPIPYRNTFQEYEIENQLSNLQEKIANQILVSQTTPNGDLSPESSVIPTEDMNTVQYRISGEKLPEIILELCDNCHWSVICFNKREIVERCPDCNKILSQISMNIDEICSLEYDDKRGVTISFDRKKPLR
jgi:hypothetical protein